jgi:hypothetical protein
MTSLMLGSLCRYEAEAGDYVGLLATLEKAVDSDSLRCSCVRVGGSRDDTARAAECQLVATLCPMDWELRVGV